MIPYEDQEEVLRDCTQRFDGLGIPYMLTGSMAMIKYAMMRMTNDIDLVVELKHSDAQRIIDAFEPDYYVPHQRVSEAIDRKKMFNILHQKMLVKVDCVIRRDDEFQRSVFSNRQKVKYSYLDFEVWIIGKEDLILSKLNWAKESRSELQMRDVTSIIRNGYNEQYVRNWAKKLGVEDILDECIRMIDVNYAE